MALSRRPSFTGHRRRHLLPFLLYLFSATIFTKSDDTSPVIIYTACGSNKTQNQQSFNVNFVNSMDIVSQKIAQKGFGISVYGNKDTVYGIGQCFSYVTSIDCQLCYAECRVKLPRCLPSATARIYLDGCFLRYADYNMTGESVDSSDARVCGNSLVNASGSTQFAQVATGLVDNLTAEAYGEKDYYKVGSEVVPDLGVSVYGMAQCWRSLNQSGCRECLGKAGESLVKCLPATDGNALNAGCSVRYSTSPFYMVGGTQNGGGSSVGRQIAVALGCLFAALVVIAIAIVWRRKYYAKSAEDMDGSSEIIKSITESNIGYKYEDLRKATDNFNSANKLGQGGYGSVYKGILMDGREVAVKRLYSNTRQWLDQFFNEVNLISQVQHKNLVKLLGCSVEGPESLLVYEYLSNRSLDNFLFDSFKKNALDWGRRFEIIVGTGEGLAYLHDASVVRIIHRDIKASNILLDERFKPKIADFGLARYFAEDQSHLSTGLAGTFGYMAPEYIVHGQLTEKADIYSYGVLVLEVMTGRRNHASAEGHSLMSLIWEHYTMKTLIELMDPYLQGQCSDQQALKVLHVGLLCTQASPNLRPPMWKIVEMLTSKSSDLPIPTQPPFLNIKGAENKSEGSGSSSLFSSTSKAGVSVNNLSVSIVQGR